MNELSKWLLPALSAGTLFLAACDVSSSSVNSGSGGSLSDPEGQAGVSGALAAEAGAATTGVAGSSGAPSTQAGGGAPGAGSAGTSGGASAGFVLSWQDDFDTLDSSAWQLQTFTFAGNEAQFSTENAVVHDGILSVSLTQAPTGSSKPYLGVEMRSAKTLTYGKVSTRMRFASGSGVVSSLVLFYTPYPNCDWNEIDIEHLGKSKTSIQLNAMVFKGTPVANCTTSVAPTQDPLVASLDFDAESEFHLYDIEWTPRGVRYFADGALLRDWTANIALLKLPATILLTIWASSEPSWAGALTATSAPTSADIDWIKVYDYVGG